MGTKYGNLIMLKKTIVCFRNDDVNDLTPELISLTEIFTNKGIPITHAVEPGNLTASTINWLKRLKKDYPELIEIVQHGWDHSIYLKGEFDNSRVYQEQLNDLNRGKEKLEDVFGEDFFPMVTIPFGVYNQDTIKAANSLQYKVFCGHYNYRISRRLFYLVGHVLGKGQLLGYHVANHLKYYPGTQLFEIDSAISFIKRYYGHHTNHCDMNNVEEMINEFTKFKKRIPVVVFLLHHRFHYQAQHMDLVREVLEKLQAGEDIRFSNYAQIYHKFSNNVANAIIKKV